MLSILSYSPRRPWSFQRLLHSLLSQRRSQNLWQGGCQLVYSISGEPVPYNVLRVTNSAQFFRLWTR